MATVVDGTLGITVPNTSSANSGAVAWVNFNGVSGASPVIRASYNIASVVRNSTGNYTVTFTNALNDANYCVVVGAFISTSTGNTGRTGGAYSYSSGSFIMQTGYVGVADDMQFMNVAVFR